MRRRRGLHAAAALALAATFSTAAVAEGPGRYRVNGTNAKEKSSYQGTITLSKTGTMTWQIIEVVGNNTFEGFGIGDGRTIAATFVGGDGSTIVALYVANADGSYTGVWASDGDQEVSTETLKPN
jgi:hypothetical protein